MSYEGKSDEALERTVEEEWTEEDGGLDLMHTHNHEQAYFYGKLLLHAFDSIVHLKL